MARNPKDLLPLNPRDYLILFILTRGECHGYGLVKAVDEQTEGLVRLDPSNLYRSLKRLIQTGLVRETDRRPSADADQERRRYYAITAFGRDVVAAEATRLRQLARAAEHQQLIPVSGRRRS